MKKQLLIALFLFIAASGGAQELVVKEFRPDPTDIAAVKYEIKDFGGEPCALIKLGLVLTDVSFEGDIIKSEYKNGEWWLYLIDGATWLNVKTKKYLPLRYEFDPLAKKTVYLMQIEVPQVKTDGPTGKMVISSNVKDADVYIDGEKVSSILPFTYEGSEGEHILKVEAAGYNPATMSFSIQLRRKLALNVMLMATGSLNVDGISYEMIPVAGGSFKMGSVAKKEKAGGFNYDKPAHYVSLRPFKIGKTEVSQALWVKIMGSNPSNNQGMDLPIENVSWHDVIEFIDKLNQQYGTNFRLPTEAEWEYAARGGGVTEADSFSGNGAFDKCVVKGVSTLPVGIKQPNSLGLHDMSGNVAEWCSDWLSKYTNDPQLNPSGPETGVQKITRGGSYADDEWFMNCSCRGHARPDVISPAIGFRLAEDN